MDKVLMNCRLNILDFGHKSALQEITHEYKDDL